MFFKNKFHSHYTCSSLNCFSNTCMLNISTSCISTDLGTLAWTVSSKLSFPAFRRWQKRSRAGRELESTVSFRMAVEYPFTTIDRWVYFITYLGGVHYCCYAKQPCAYILVHRFACFPKNNSQKENTIKIVFLTGTSAASRRIVPSVYLFLIPSIWKGGHFPHTHANTGYYSFNFFPNQRLKNAFL